MDKRPASTLHAVSLCRPLSLMLPIDRQDVSGSCATAVTRGLPYRLINSSCPQIKLPSNQVALKSSCPQIWDAHSIPRVRALQPAQLAQSNRTGSGGLEYRLKGRLSAVAGRFGCKLTVSKQRQNKSADAMLPSEVHVQHWELVPGGVH